MKSLVHPIALLLSHFYKDIGNVGNEQILLNIPAFYFILVNTHQTFKHDVMTADEIVKLDEYHRYLYLSEDY